MRPPPVRLLVILALGAPIRAAGQSGPSEIVHSLEAVLDRGRADSARRVWTAASRRRTTAPAPVWALATLDRLEYRYAAARPRLVALMQWPDPAGASWRAAARLAMGRWLVLSGDSSGTGFLSSAAATADSAGAATVGTEARLELARAMARAGQFDSARGLVERAHAMAPPADSAVSALAMCSAASFSAGPSPARADSLLARGLALARAADSKRVVARCLTMGHQILLGRGLTAKAALLLDEAMTAIGATTDAEAGALISQLRGFLYIQYSYGLANGRDLALKAIRLARRSGSGLAEGYAHLNLAQLAIRLGDFRVASARRDTGLALLRRLGDRQGQAAAEFVAGDAAFATGDLARAERSYRASAQLYRSLRLRAYLVDLRLALLAIDRREFGQARELIEGAVAEAGKDGNRGFALDRLYYEGLLALREDRYPDAAGLFRRFREAQVPGALQYRLDAGTREAEALALAGRFDEATLTLDSALAAIEGVRRVVSDRDPAMNRDVQYALAGSRRFEFDQDLGLATIVAAFAKAGRADAAFRFAEAERARTLWVRLTRRTMLRDSAGTKRVWPRILVPSELSIADLTRTLGDHTALLAFSTGAGGEPTTVFVLDRRGVRTYPAPPGDSLVAPIERFASLAAAGTWAKPLGRALGAALLDLPLASLDSAVDRLVIVPDGPLFRFPFEAVPLVAGGPLLARYQVSIAPSARLAGGWLAGQSPTPGRGSVVAFGDARFDPAQHLARLPGSGDEARLATGGGARGKAWFGAAASEAAFKRLDSVPARIIHLATHARTEDAGILTSAVFLAAGGGEDGRVGPDEIAGREFDADLVLLTGCRTNGGALMFGEGIQGLVAPFLEAGVRAVIATLWDVGDRRIIPLVGDFYRELERGAEAGTALRTARLASWRRGDSPAVWASLTLTGNTRVRPFGAVQQPR